MLIVHSLKKIFGDKRVLKLKIENIVFISKNVMQRKLIAVAYTLGTY